MGGEWVGGEIIITRTRTKRIITERYTPRRVSPPQSCSFSSLRRPSTHLSSPAAVVVWCGVVVWWCGVVCGVVCGGVVCGGVVWWCGVVCGGVV